MTFDLVENGVLTIEELEAFGGSDVDLSLLHSEPKALESATTKYQRNILIKVEDFCQKFEEKLNSIGGIGFFLGGIGPDGHIAFNQVRVAAL